MRARRVLGSALLAGVMAAGVGCSGSSDAPSAGSDDGGGGGQESGGEDRGPAEWVRLGLDLANSRAAEDETTIDPANVADLEPSWELDGVRGVTGTPVVADGVVYVGDWTGHMRALDAATGEERWSRDLETSYIGGAAVVDGPRVVVGTFGARVVALDRATGEVDWEVRVDDHPGAVIFGSPVAVGGRIVVGVASFEVFTGGAAPTFRGSVVSLDAETGEEQWRFWVTAGDETEGPGVSIWSSPAIDLERGHVYIGTGQAYALPAPPRSDAVLALDLETGEEVWSTQFTEGDAWTLASPTGLDADVGAPPNLFTAGDVDAVGVGDKDGVYRALDRDTGEIAWERRLTEGGLQGGVMASAAVHGGHVYVTSNDDSQDADLFALDEDSGEVAWRVPVEGHVTGPVTWANDVVYVADDSGRFSAFAAGDGERLWTHEVAAPAAGGISVVDGTVYGGWGWWLTGAPEDPQGGLIAFRLGDAGSGDGSDGGGDGSDGGDADGGSGEALGEEVYDASCASCHGGDGQGASGPPLTGVDERLTREQHVEVVREGRGSMPGWEGDLTDEEIDAVVDYERTVLAGG